MIRRLYPEAYIDSVYDLDLDLLKQSGIKGIIFDIDNTLVPYDEEIPNDKIFKFLKGLEEDGFKVALVSNNTKDRVTLFNKELEFIAHHNARKPLTKGIKNVIEKLGCKKDEVIIVGDQVFTDVYGGNMTGIKPYLVKPISDKDEWITKIKRGLERRVVNRYLRDRDK